MNILTMRDEMVQELVEEGYSFMDGLVQISPRVLGLWASEAAVYDEKVHRRTVDLVPTAAFRKALKAIGVKVLSVQNAKARITCITDTATGLKDGTLTIGDDIIIEGEKLKIDEKDGEQGVFFLRPDGTEIKTKRRLSINKPSQIIARVPETLAEGEVTVVVRTKYVKGTATLKEIHEIVYNYPCKAKT